MKELIGYLAAAAMLALFILAWKPLHRRFSGWAIVAAYMMFLFALAILGSVKSHEQWVPVLVVVIGILVLFANRQKPIEKRKPTVAWAVIHGLWDQLEKEGLPPDEIERLKRMTVDERARLMAELRRPLEKLKLHGANKVRHIYGTLPGDYVWDEEEHF